MMAFNGLFLKIATRGSVSGSRILGAEKPSKAPLGGICVGRKWNGMEMEGYEIAEKAIDKVLNHFIEQGVVDSRGKYGDMQLVIKEDEMVRINGQDPDYTEDEDVDWNLLDEDDFDDYGEDE